MSSWDQGEVLKLSKHGNSYAMNVWLGNAPDVGTNGRPKEGDDINLFKRFIVDVYEKKLYYCEPPGDSVDNGGSSGVVEQAAASINQQHLQIANNRASQQQQNRRAVQQPKKPAPPQQQQPAVDLLDFGTFDNALPSVAPQPTVVEMTKAAAPTTIQQVATSSSVQQPAPFDPFNMNQSQNTTAAAVASNSASNADPFSSTNVTSTPSNTANVFGTSSSATMGRASNDAPFDPFSSHGGFTSSSTTMAVNNSMNGMQRQQPQPIMNTPVMNGVNMNGSIGSGVANGSGNMMNGSGNMMNGGNMMGNNIMMMNGSVNQGMGMMNGSGNNMMMNSGMMMNSSQGNMGMLNTSHHQQQQSQPAMAMNMNIMQPRNNSISNMGSPSSNGVVSGGGSRSGGGAAAKVESKSDPFAGLGF